MKNRSHSFVYFSARYFHHFYYIHFSAAFVGHMDLSFEFLGSFFGVKKLGDENYALGKTPSI